MSKSTTIAIVILGAMFLALTFAAPAYAAFGSGYVTWGEVQGLPGNSGSDSPHGGYTTNTVKCAVCHAVHSASPTGEVLLHSSVAEACTYCHIDTNEGTQVYGGQRANYFTASDYGHQTSSVIAQDAKCVFCHQVHAASEFMTLNEYLTKRILSGDQVQQYPVSYDERYDTAPQPLAVQSKEAALTEWCTKCHRGDEYGYYSPYYNDKTHVMTGSIGSYGNDQTGVQGSQVAFASSEYCFSCHNSGYGTSAWPHYSTSKRWLPRSAGGSAPSMDITGTLSTNIDGVCLRCHKSDTAGVGSTF